MKLIIWIFTLLILGCKDKSDLKIQGYLEADYIYLSSETGGKIRSIMKSRGDQVSKEERLISLDNDMIVKDREVIVNKIIQENISLRNIEEGIRESELKILNIQLAKLQAEYSYNQSKLRKLSSLKEKGYISIEEANDAQNRVELISYEISRLRAEIEHKKLPARLEEINLQKEKIESLKISLNKADIEIEKKNIFSSESGVVQDIFYKEGENVISGEPIIMLLPENSVKAKFYISNKNLHKVDYGKEVYLIIPGEEKKIRAKISYVSRKPEYTPPIIYHNEQDNLLFLVEAIPQQSSKHIVAGLPVEVEL